MDISVDFLTEMKRILKFWKKNTFNQIWNETKWDEMGWNVFKNCECVSVWFIFRLMSIFLPHIFILFTYLCSAISSTPFYFIFIYIFTSHTFTIRLVLYRFCSHMTSNYLFYRLSIANNCWENDWIFLKWSNLG